MCLLLKQNVNDILKQIDDGWQKELTDEFNKPYFEGLVQFVNQERESGKSIFPKQSDVFNALKYTPFNSLKVVIMGQDPYHGINQANGLCFSVNRGIRHPPSLQNIFKELYSDLGIDTPIDGCLKKWAEQGVLLLNRTLTVVEGKPLSHHGIGWETFTDAIIEKVCLKDKPCVFALWGKNAQDTCLRIKKESKTTKEHYLLKSPHPSPLSAHRGFFGCRHFSKINEVLASKGMRLIDWRL